MRRGLATLLVVGLAASCGGGGDGGDGGDDVASDIALEPILDVDPCGLLGGDDAAELTGGDVERDEAVGGSLGGAIGCTYRFRRDQGEVTGGAIAASLLIDEGTNAAEALEEPGGDAVEVDLGDGGVVVTGPAEVEVVYVVETTVVSLVVAPVDGEVDDAFVEDVVDFAETTVDPITQAVEEKVAADEGDETATPEESTTTTPDEETAEEGSGDSSNEVRQEEISGLWTGDWGTMVLREVDGEVRGVYDYQEGTITGTFTDGVFTGWWTEASTRQPPGDAGEVIFEFAKTNDGSIALDGRWRYGAEGDFNENWDLVLSEEEAPEALEARFENEDEFIEQP